MFYLKVTGYVNKITTSDSRLTQRALSLLENMVTNGYAFLIDYLFQLVSLIYGTVSDAGRGGASLAVASLALF